MTGGGFYGRQASRRNKQMAVARFRSECHFPRWNRLHDGDGPHPPRVSFRFHLSLPSLAQHFSSGFPSHHSSRTTWAGTSCSCGRLRIRSSLCSIPAFRRRLNGDQSTTKSAVMKMTMTMTANISIHTDSETSDEG